MKLFEQETERDVDKLIRNRERQIDIEEKINNADSKSKKVRYFIGGIAYALLMIVVVYGMGHYVYGGFPGFVPYLIIIIFAAMSGWRFWQYWELKSK